MTAPSRPPLYVRHPFLAGLLRQLPLLAALVGVAVGLAVVTFADWRAGLVVLGIVLLGTAALRQVLPVRRAGFLAVRSRPFDVVLLVGAGIGLIVIALTLPMR
jgi:Protein of unknown function (DUF3017)